MASSNVVFFSKLNPDAKLPTRGTPMAAGYDVYSVETVTIPPMERRAVSTGMAFHMPDGIYGRIAPRSGLALHECIDIGGGVVDPDYRGDVRVIMINASMAAYKVDIGQRIAQIVFELVCHPSLVEVDSLAPGFRGANAFGSTGR